QERTRLRNVAGEAGVSYNSGTEQYARLSAEGLRPSALFITRKPAREETVRKESGGSMNNLEKPVYVSADGLKKIQAELDDLKAAGRQRVAERIHAAMEFGDFTENSELEQAKNDQAFLEGRILTLEQMVKNAQIIDEKVKLLQPGRPHVVRDSKTPSGPVPISGLRGPIISDALFRTFKANALDVRFVYTIDDYDPMDSQSMKERAGMAAHMGKPLCMIPSPDPSVGTDFADYHATRFIALFARLGITPEVHRIRDLYRSGALDKQIDLVLRNAETIRAIHKRVANVDHPEGWLPVAVICENCGRIGTTLATDYDGTTVAYECRRDYVEWAEGCGHVGRVAPFGGNAKLLWNEQWCAQWDHFGV